MRDLKNIDRLYQENLKDFEVFPPNKAWRKIEKDLVVLPNKKRVPIWFKIASIAALFILFFSVGTIYLMPDNQFTRNFLPNLISEDKIDNNEEQNNSVEVVDTSKEEIQKDKLDINREIANSKATVIDGELDSSSEQTNIQKKDFNEYSLADAANLPLKENDNLNKIKPKNLKTENRFSVATVVAPIYFSSFGDGSGVGEQFGDNAVAGKSSYSYGVKFAYKINNKFSVQSGVNLISLGYKSNDVYVTPGVAVLGISNVSNNPISAKGSAVASAKDNGADNTENNKASLNQNFGYIEIPVEIKYNVKDGKLGVNLVGGFSTLLLNNDEVYIESNGLSQSLGSSNNLRSINFSGNLGVDLDYSIHKNLYINVSPMFKVQTNTFSRNSGSFLPYYLGVYTGINYKF